MRFITNQEETAMRKTQAQSMNDLCSITTYTTTTDSLGDVVASGVTISGVACGVSFVGAFEGRSVGDGHTQVAYDAIIRLPLTVAIDIDSKITILDKQDTSIRKVFKPTTFPEVGPTAQNVKVERITT